MGVDLTIFPTCASQMPNNSDTSSSCSSTSSGHKNAAHNFFPSEKKKKRRLENMTSMHCLNVWPHISTACQTGFDPKRELPPFWMAVTCHGRQVSNGWCAATCEVIRHAARAAGPKCCATTARSESDGLPAFKCRLQLWKAAKILEQNQNGYVGKNKKNWSLAV